MYWTVSEHGNQLHVCIYKGLLYLKPLQDILDNCVNNFFLEKFEFLTAVFIKILVLL